VFLYCIFLIVSPVSSNVYYRWSSIYCQICNKIKKTNKEYYTFGTISNKIREVVVDQSVILFFCLSFLLVWWLFSDQQYHFTWKTRPTSVHCFVYYRWSSIYCQICNKIKKNKQRIPHLRNNFKFKYQNRRKRQDRKICNKTHKNMAAHHVTIISQLVFISFCSLYENTWGRCWPICLAFLLS
jgi:hypothetical protein